MARTAHKSLVEFGARAVDITGEAMEQDAGLEYQITDATRRLLDPLGSVTVYENGIAVAASTYTVDHLFGKVIFAAAPTTPVTIDATYIPRVRFACARDFNISCERVSLDTTCMAPETVARARIMGLKDVSTSVGMLEDLPLYQEYTIGGTVKTLNDILNDEDTPLVFSVRPGNEGDTFRAFVRIASHDASAELEDLVESGIDFVGAARGIASYSWGTA